MPEGFAETLVLRLLLRTAIAVIVHMQLVAQGANIAPLQLATSLLVDGGTVGRVWTPILESDPKSRREGVLPNSTLSMQRRGATRLVQCLCVPDTSRPNYVATARSTVRARCSAGARSA